MVRIIFSLMMIIGGLLFISLEIYDTYNKTTKNAIKDNSILNKKHIEAQRLLNLITGSCFVVLGTILILNIVTGNLIWILCSLILFLDKIVEFIIIKKYKEID